jgi:hypothetical protein
MTTKAANKEEEEEEYNKSLFPKEKKKKKKKFEIVFYINLEVQMQLHCFSLIVQDFHRMMLNYDDCRTMIVDLN